jgi:transposase-like protein
VAFKKVKADLRKAQGADVDPKAEAVRLYQEGRSTTEIGQQLNVGGTTVWKWLHGRGVKRRTRSEAIALSKAPSKEILAKARAAYSAGATMDTIAHLLEIDAATVRRYLKRQGVQVKSAVEVNAPDPHAMALAVKKYQSGESLDAVGRAMGISGVSVLRWLDSAGVPRRGTADALRANKATVEEAARRYADGEAPSKIAKDLGVTRRSVCRWAKAAGVAIRAPGKRARHA